MNNEQGYNFPHVDRIHRPTSAEFVQHYGALGKPVLIQGIMDEWPAMTRWTPRFFGERYGDVQVTVKRSKDLDDIRTLSVKEYIDYMETTNDDDPYYLKDWHIENDCPEVMQDYVPPDYFHSWHWRLPKEIRPKWKWFYIGPKHTGSRMHVDVMMSSAWNAVISGEKHWLFYPPEQEPYLYKGKVNAFNHDADQYPLFSRACPFLCIQKPGEVVFTPSGWWHQVLNKESCVSITENFVNSSNRVQFKKHLSETELPDYAAQAIREYMPELCD